MHHKIQHRNEAIKWAQNVLATPNAWVILDTETTGIGKDDVVIQIGIIDLYKNTLIDSLVRPTKKKSIPIEATSIHGITMDMLLSAPTLSEMLNHLMTITRQKKTIIYNAGFDIRLLNQTIYQDNIHISKGKLIMNYECAMTYYAQFVGQWSDYHQNYVYQKLPSSEHNAIGDCKATLDIIKMMAGTKMKESM
jgi:DNA polymerase-3 subunit epsilon